MEVENVALDVRSNQGAYFVAWNAAQACYADALQGMNEDEGDDTLSQAVDLVQVLLRTLLQAQDPVALEASQLRRLYFVVLLSHVLPHFL